ncbi:hypothetical protein DFJ43DRAFT_1142752 [Lentinula guzmanii]|uniref:Uncharacterized protein n=1 Tax=Lentinula guzmanii TaxID=2804957 RepID=A0AA38J901_9AGAR|nr:hypothetical protein DFJ43DRAFT_1142752 [Lentinula guzmanii]
MKKGAATGTTVGPLFLTLPLVKKRDKRKNVLVSHDFKGKSDSDWSSRKMSFPSRGEFELSAKDMIGKRKRLPQELITRVGVLARTNTKHTRLPRKEGSASSQGQIQTQSASSQGRVGRLNAENTGSSQGAANGHRAHTNGFLARKGLGVTMRQIQKHGLLARSGKWALSAVGITAARDTQLIGRTGAHNLLKYWGPERFGNDQTRRRQVGGMSLRCSTREQGGKKGRKPLSFQALQTKTCTIMKKGAATGTTVGPLFLTTQM